jgi:hypothetical protein
MAPYAARIILLLPAIIFALIGMRDVFHADQTGAASGIVLHMALGHTILRVAFGAFPLGCSIYMFFCLLAGRRVLMGLSFTSIMIGVVLAVRVFGMLTDGTVQESMRLVRIEGSLWLLTVLGLVLEAQSIRRKRQFASEETII